MTTAAAGPQIVPRRLCAPPTRASSALESVLSDNTRRVYKTQWRLFTDWCGDVGLRALPAEPLTVARYLATSLDDPRRGQCGCIDGGCSRSSASRTVSSALGWTGAR